MLALAALQLVDGGIGAGPAFGQLVEVEGGNSIHVGMVAESRKLGIGKIMISGAPLLANDAASPISFSGCNECGESLGCCLPLRKLRLIESMVTVSNILAKFIVNSEFYLRFAHLGAVPLQGISGKLAALQTRITEARIHGGQIIPRSRKRVKEEKIELRFKKEVKLKQDNQKTVQVNDGGRW